MLKPNPAFPADGIILSIVARLERKQKVIMPSKLAWQFLAGRISIVLRKTKECARCLRRRAVMLEADQLGVLSPDSLMRRVFQPFEIVREGNASRLWRINPPAELKTGDSAACSRWGMHCL